MGAAVVDRTGGAVFDPPGVPDGHLFGPSLLDHKPSGQPGRPGDPRLEHRGLRASYRRGEAARRCHRPSLPVVTGPGQP